MTYMHHNNCRSNNCLNQCRDTNRLLLLLEIIFIRERLKKFHTNTMAAKKKVVAKKKAAPKKKKAAPKKKAVRRRA